MPACLALLPFDDQQLSVLHYARRVAPTLDLKVSGVLVPPSQEIPAYLFDHAGLGVPHIPSRDETADEALRSNILATWDEAKAGSSAFRDCAVLESVNEEKANAIGRCSDLVFALRPGTLASPGYDLMVRAAIMEGGAPVVVLPPGQREQEFNLIAVVWNGTLQSSRALRGALPLIRAFKSVVVLQTRADTAGSAVDYLASHGVTAETKMMTVKGSARERGRRIVEESRTLGADMVVMGAYSEGRVGRYLGFGGATEKVMTGAGVPVVFAR
ncbi:MAG: universal stress protein [Pseudomonadota bacterium]